VYSFMLSTFLQEELWVSITLLLGRIRIKNKLSVLCRISGNKFSVLCVSLLTTI
jgi:hypothetical protein